MLASIVDITKRKTLENRIRRSTESLKPEFLPFVFDRFTQQDSSIRRAHGGLGLGLSIVRYLVELHGGKVSVQSEGLGRGAAFRVALPLIKKMAEQTTTGLL